MNLHVKGSGKIEIPDDLIADIENRLRQAIDEFMRKYRERPMILALNRMGYGAVRATTYLRPDYDSVRPLSVFEYDGVRIICIPDQSEFVKAVGDAEHAFFYE